MKTITKIYFGALCGWTLLTAALRSFCLLTRYDPALGYLTDGFLSLLPSLLLLVGIAASFSAFLLRTKHPTTEAPSKAESLIRASVAALCFFSGILFLINRTSNSMFLYVLTGITAICLAIFFFLSCSPDTTKSAEKTETLRPWFYLVGIFMLLLLLISSYFDMTVTINGPFATPTVFSVLFGCLFFLMEVRAVIGRPLPRLHVSVAAVSFFFCGSVGISGLVFSIWGSAGNAVTVSEPARPMLFLAVGLAAAARLIALFKCDQTTSEHEEK